VGPSTPHQRFFFNLGALAAAVLLIVSAAVPSSASASGSE